MVMSKGKISEKEIVKIKASLKQDPSFCLARNALTRGNLQDVAMNWERFSLIDHTFSEKVTPECKAVDVGFLLH
jgi:hypothetical protein